MKGLQKIINQHIDNGLYHGVQWKITHKGNTNEGKSGIMNFNSREPIYNNSIYRIWSMTKPIISVVILQLVEEKKIKLNDILTEYLPQFKNLKVLKSRDSLITDVVEINSMPTIKDLLSHTAGFTYSFLGDVIGREYERVKLFHSETSTLEDEINLLSSIPLLCQPSTQWVYSVSIDILARIIEIITKNDLQLELKKRIFDPLEMNDTGFTVEPNHHHRIMTTYEFNPYEKKLKDLIPGVQKIGNFGYPFNYLNYARGGHGLYSTLDDYSRFAQMLLNGKTIRGESIISKSMLLKATTNHLDSCFFPLEIKNIAEKTEENDLEPYGWGLGFRVMMDIEKANGIGSIGEFGWAGAAATFFLIDPKNDLTGVLMTQVLGADSILKKDFVKEIYKNL